MFPPPPPARWCRAGRSRAPRKIDRASEAGLALDLDGREDISGGVEPRTAEQDAREVHRSPGQPGSGRTMT